MDKEAIEIKLIAKSGSRIDDPFTDERTFNVTVGSRAEVSALFDEFCSLIDSHKGWEQ